MRSRVALQTWRVQELRPSSLYLFFLPILEIYQTPLSFAAAADLCQAAASSPPVEADSHWASSHLQMANGESPIKDPTAWELKIAADGDLDQSKSTIWSIDDYITPNSTVSVALRDGVVNAICKVAVDLTESNRLSPEWWSTPHLPSHTSPCIESQISMALPGTPCFFLFLSFFFFIEIFQTPLSSCVVAADIDTISAGRSLSGSRNLTSAGGKFMLGFFTPPDVTSNKYYVGIWFNKISLFTPVWVANRETPVEDPITSELKIAGDGNLVLLDQSRSIIWSTSTDISVSTVAVILDTGNLQLRDELNSSLIFWQSLDHPTDTWLPGGKIGSNKATNQSQRLVAWKNKADPAPGIFSFGTDPDGTLQYLLYWNMSEIYWTSGVWDGHVFPSLPKIDVWSRPLNVSVQFVARENENYLTYNESFNNENSTTRVALDYNSGQIQALEWQEDTSSWISYWTIPGSKCSVYALCGPFGSCNDFSTPFCSCLKGFTPKSKTDWDLGDKTGGCARKVPLQCNQKSSINSEKDGFFEISNVKLPDPSQTLAMVGSTSDDCESACLKNCSCTGYSFNSSGCFMWFNGLLNLQERYPGSDASTFYLRLAATELQSSNISKNKLATPAIAGIIVGALAACFLLVRIMVSIRRRWRMSNKVRVVGNSLVHFTYNDLKHATRNFSEKLGGGGFGLVFKGYLSEDSPIAVKKLQGLRQGEKQFRAEISTIGVIQHVNLVRLLGFCSEATKRLLVYEFIPNGSLDRVLFHDGSNALDWTTRYQIAVGTARGLAYLHEKCRDCIIHCDVKPENILLDASFTPKVADFGLAKLMGRDFSRVLTTVRGTRGYLAPEWITGTPITAKADVYSYGMMLFEIISGRRNSIQTGESSFDFFPQFALSKLAFGDAQSLVDVRLAGEADREEVERAFKLAYWCIQDEESGRPTMRQAVQVLEGLLDMNMPPVPRSFHHF